MEDKTKNQKIMRKIKVIKKMTPGAGDSNLKAEDKEKYNSTHNNIQKVTITSDIHTQKPLAEETDLLHQKIKNKSKSKSKEKKKEKETNSFFIGVYA